MAVYRFKVTFEDHEEIYRDIEIKSTQNLEDFHNAILQSIHFDNRHNASFFISDDYWRKGNEYVLRNELQKDKRKPALPESALMSKCKLASVIDDPHQRFVYIYDYAVAWTLLIELTKILPDNPKVSYPFCFKSTGIAPKQYNDLVIPKGEIEEDFLDEEEDEIVEDDDAYATASEDVELLEGEEGETAEEEVASEEEEIVSEDDEDFGASEFNDNDHFEEF